MSSALPCGTPSMTSNSTTSPSSFKPASKASVPPICPAPTSAILLRAIPRPLRLGGARVLLRNLDGSKRGVGARGCRKIGQIAQKTDLEFSGSFVSVPGSQLSAPSSNRPRPEELAKRAASRRTSGSAPRCSLEHARRVPLSLGRQRILSHSGASALVLRDALLRSAPQDEVIFCPISVFARALPPPPRNVLL